MKITEVNSTPGNNSYREASGPEQAAGTRSSQEASEIKMGKRVNSFLKYAKKVVNVPIKLVRNHPKITLAAGLITTLIGGLTVSPVVISLGVVLIAAGSVAILANGHTDIKDKVDRIQQQNIDQPSTSAHPA